MLQHHLQHAAFGASSTVHRCRYIACIALRGHRLLEVPLLRVQHIGTTEDDLAAIALHAPSCWPEEQTTTGSTLRRMAPE